MSTRDEKRPAEVEQDIEQTRVSMDKTLDALQAKLSPGQLVDQVLAYTKQSGSGHYFSNLARTVQQNPLPVALVGLGLGWLMLSNSNASKRPSAPEADDVEAYYPEGYHEDVYTGVDPDEAEGIMTSDRDADTLEREVQLAPGFYGASEVETSESA